MAIDLKDFVRDIPNYPTPGIIFKDITPLLQNAEALRQSIAEMVAITKQYDITHIAGIESRGFIFGTALAAELGLGFLPIRKPGKLPSKTFAEAYDLEYGSDKLEIHVDASRLISLDTTGLDALKTWLQDLQKASIGVHVHGLQPQPASLMQRTGFLPLLKSYDAEEATQGTRATSD